MPKKKKQEIRLIRLYAEDAKRINELRQGTEMQRDTIKRILSAYTK